MIPRALKGPVLRRMSERPVRFIEPVGPRSATGLTHAVYQQAQHEFFLGAPLTVHSPAPALIAALWIAGRETIIVHTAVERGVKEALAAAVSSINTCPYCVDMHVTMAHADAQHEAAQAVLDSDTAQITDPRVQRIIEWALATRTPGAPALQDPPFDARDRAELVGTAFFFHYVNRVVNTFLTESALRSPVQSLQPAMLRLFGWELRGDLALDARPGESLALLDDAPLDDAFAWARDTPTIAGAFARWNAAVERAGEVVPQAARTRLLETLARWNGEDPALGSAWIRDASDGLDGFERDAFALLARVALASWTITDDVIEAWRRGNKDSNDAALVATVSWAAFATARRIVEWVAPPFPSH